MARSLLLSLLLLSLWAAHDVADGEHGHGDLAEELSSQGMVVSNSSNNQGHYDLLNNATDWEIFPHSGLESRFFNSSRRTLGSFQVCALCTCCGEQRRFCIPTACCYSITCGSPNRPFGLCSFTPMSCSCLSCRL
eukprot:c20253_g1_i1 orf=190-594(-)